MNYSKLKFSSLCILFTVVLFASCKSPIVYIAGFEGTHYGDAILWKNGIAQNLSDGSEPASAESVFVLGKDVFVVGHERNESGNWVAKLWKNGIAQNISSETFDASAGSIFVK